MGSRVRGGISVWLCAVFALVTSTSCRQLVGPEPDFPALLSWNVTVVDLSGRVLKGCTIYVENFSPEEDGIDFGEAYRADEAGWVRLIFPAQIEMQVTIDPRDGRPQYPLRLPDPQSSPAKLVYAARPMQRPVDLGGIDPSALSAGSIGLQLERPVIRDIRVSVHQSTSVDPDGLIRFWASDDMLLDYYSMHLELGALAIEWRRSQPDLPVGNLTVVLPPVVLGEVEVVATGTDFPQLPGVAAFVSGDYRVESTILDLRSERVTLLAPAGPGRIEVRAFSTPPGILAQRDLDVD